MALTVASRPPLAPPTIVHAAPPDWIWRLATVELGANGNTVFTYGDTIFVPSGNALPPDLIAHEGVHRRQQGTDPDGWWQRYFADVPFRLEQEIAAYRRQYAAYAGRERYRLARQQFLARLAASLAGPLYGRMIDVPTAAALITGVMVRNG